MQHSDKLGPELKLTLEQPAAEEAASELSALARVERGGLTDDQRAALLDMGVTLRSEAGDIVTLSVPASGLDQLVSFDWILYIEASRPLTAEEEGAPPPSAFE